MLVKQPLWGNRMVYNLIGQVILIETLNKKYEGRMQGEIHYISWYCVRKHM